MRFRIGTLLPVGVVLFFSYALFEARDFSFVARIFPLVAGTGGLILGLLGLVADLRAKGKIVGQEGLIDLAPDQSLPVAVMQKRALRVISWLLGLYLGIWVLGFKISIALFFFLFLRFSGRLGWRLTVGLTAFAVFLFLFAFEKLLTLYWPEGLIGPWLKEILPWLF